MKRGFTLLEILIVMAIIAIAVAVALPAVYTYTSAGRGTWNRHMYNVQKTDDATRYDTRRQVEDTCRAMQASYLADVATRNVYLKSGNNDWAAQMAVRANRTAASYNEFILKNSFVWEGNIPPDIKNTLPPIQ